MVADGVPGRAHGHAGARVLARAQVAGELRVAAAGHEDPDAGAGLETVGGGAQRQRHGDVAGRPVRVEADVALGDVVRAALAVDLRHAHEEVCVWVVGGVGQPDDRGADDVQVAGQDRAGEGQDVAALGQLRVVDRAAQRQQRAADRRRGVGRVEGEPRRRPCGGRRVLGQAAIGMQEERVLRRLGRPVGQVAPSGAAGPGQKDVHGAGAARAGGRPSGQMLVEPAQRLLARHPQPAGADGQVRPVTDRQGHVHATGPEALVLVHGLLQEEVLPAADEEDGDFDPLEGGGVLHGRPEGVGRLGPCHPVGVPGCPPTQDRVRRPGQRERVHVGADPPGRRDGAQRPAQPAAVLLVHNAVAPAQEVEPEGAGTPDVLLEVVRPDGHDSRRQLGGRVGHEGPLGVPQVRAPDSGEAAGEPGLVAHPGHHVEPVVHLGLHGPELSARAEGAAAAHEEDVVAPRREDPRLGHGQGQGTAIRPPHQNGPDDVGRRLVEVRRQLDAVAHRDAHAGRQREVGRGGGEAAQAGGQRVHGLGGGAAARRLGVGVGVVGSMSSLIV